MEGNVEFFKEFVTANTKARDMISEKINQVMEKIKNVDESEKVVMDNGVAYTKVNTRNKIFREVFGAYARITTDTVYHKDQKVIVKALVEINVLGKWEEFATGISEEYLDRYNAFACIETAETSAIGRALACMGISGDEYASSNEIAASQQNRSDGDQKRSESEKGAKEGKKVKSGQTIKVTSSKGRDDSDDGEPKKPQEEDKKITKASVKAITKKLAMNPEYGEDDLFEIYSIKDLAEMKKSQYEDLKKRLDDEEGFKVTLFDVKKALDDSGFPVDRFFGDMNIKSFEELPESEYESSFILFKNRKKLNPPTAKRSESEDKNSEPYVL